MNMNYGLKKPLDYFTEGVPTNNTDLTVIAIDQAKFNLTWLAFPEIELRGLEYISAAYVSNIHEYMDKETRAHLGMLPLSFMRYWEEQARCGPMHLSQEMPTNHLARMTLQAHKAQARIVLREGNLVTPQFWRSEREDH